MKARHRPAKAVQYTHCELGPSRVVRVEHLDPDEITQDLGSSVLKLLTKVHTNRLESEKRQNPLPHGSVSRHFMPDSTRAAQLQRERMIKATREGDTQYWRASIGDDAFLASPVGLGRATPFKDGSAIHGLL